MQSHAGSFMSNLSIVTGIATSNIAFTVLALSHGQEMLNKS